MDCRTGSRPGAVGNGWYVSPPPVMMRATHPEIYFDLEIARNMRLVQTAFTCMKPG
jgi:hypothetical protein